MTLNELGYHPSGVVAAMRRIAELIVLALLLVLVVALLIAILV